MNDLFPGFAALHPGYILFAFVLLSAKIEYGAKMNIPEISVHELKALLDANEDVFILDVRNPNEFAICHLNGTLIPMNELPSRMNELNPEQRIVVHCHAGGRSRRAVEFLSQHGFKNVANLRGGITAWAEEIDLTMTKY